jgi:hypothetical protein
MSGNNTQNAAIPDKHHIELVAVSERDRNGQGAKMGKVPKWARCNERE